MVLKVLVALSYGAFALRMDGADSDYDEVEPFGADPPSDVKLSGTDYWKCGVCNFEENPNIVDECINQACGAKKGCWACSMCKAKNKPGAMLCTSCWAFRGVENFEDVPAQGGVDNTAAVRLTQEDDEWACSRCTYKNVADAMECGVCGWTKLDDQGRTDDPYQPPLIPTQPTAPPYGYRHRRGGLVGPQLGLGPVSRVEKYWKCGACGYEENICRRFADEECINCREPREPWYCKGCTMKNAKSRSLCSMCHTPKPHIPFFPPDSQQSSPALPADTSTTPSISPPRLADTVVTIPDGFYLKEHPRDGTCLFHSIYTGVFKDPLQECALFIPELESWTCPRCTFVNADAADTSSVGYRLEMHPSCQVCHSPKPTTGSEFKGHQLRKFYIDMVKEEWNTSEIVMANTGQTIADIGKEKDGAFHEKIAHYRHNPNYSDPALSDQDVWYANMEANKDQQKQGDWGDIADVYVLSWFFNVEIKIYELDGEHGLSPEPECITPYKYNRDQQVAAVVTLLHYTNQVKGGERQADHYDLLLRNEKAQVEDDLLAALDRQGKQIEHPSVGKLRAALRFNDYLYSRFHQVWNENMKTEVKAVRRIQDFVRQHLVSTKNARSPLDDEWEVIDQMPSPAAHALPKSVEGTEVGVDEEFQRALKMSLEMDQKGANDVIPTKQPEKIDVQPRQAAPENDFVRQIRMKGVIARLHAFILHGNAAGIEDLIQKDGFYAEVLEAPDLKGKTPLENVFLKLDKLYEDNQKSSEAWQNHSRMVHVLVDAGASMSLDLLCNLYRWDDLDLMEYVTRNKDWEQHELEQALTIG